MNIFDSLFGPPIKKDGSVTSDWNQAMTEGRDSYGLGDGASPGPELSHAQAGMGPLQPTPPNPYDRSADEIISIYRKNSRPFKIIDINPFSTDQDNFRCQVKGEYIRELIGIEGNDTLTTNGDNDDSNFLPFWRTVEIDMIGTSLHIEYLPARDNDESPLNAGGSLPNLGPPIPDQTGLSNGLNDRGVSIKHASDRMILLNFDDVIDPPHIGSDGKKFKLPFNKIFVTFKTNSPRIRLTVGFNTEIVSPTDHQVIMNDPSMAPGHGIWKDAFLHCTPFSVNTGAILTTASLGFFDATGGSVDARDLGYITTSATLPYSQNNAGVAVGWITSITVTLQGSTSSAFSPVYAACIYVTNGGGQKVLKYFPIQPVQQSLGVLAYTIASETYVVPMALPMRFCIKHGEYLRAKFYTLNGPATTYSIALDGYVYGRSQIGASRVDPVTNAVNVTPLNIIDRLSEHPFPLDDYNFSPLQVP